MEVSNIETNDIEKSNIDNIDNSINEINDQNNNKIEDEKLDKDVNLIVNNSKI